MPVDVRADGQSNLGFSLIKPELLILIQQMVDTSYQTESEIFKIYSHRHAIGPSEGVVFNVDANILSSKIIGVVQKLVTIRRIEAYPSF
jgi:hypothetical protein